MSSCFKAQDVLAEFSEIDRVWIWSNPDVQLEVEQIYFTLVGQPEVTYFAYGMDGSSKAEFRDRLAKAIREKTPVTRPVYAVEYPR